MFFESGFLTFIRMFKHLHLRVDGTFNSKILCVRFLPLMICCNPTTLISLFMPVKAMSRISADILNVVLGYLWKTTFVENWSDIFCFRRPYHFTFFKGCLSKLVILIGPFVNSLSHMSHFDRHYFFKQTCFVSNQTILRLCKY